MNRWRVVIVVVAMLALSLVASAQVAVTAAPLVTYGVTSVTTTALGIPSGAHVSRQGVHVTRCVGVPETVDLRMGIQDIITPTSAVGVLIKKDIALVIEGEDNINRVLFISSTGDAATIRWACSAPTR